MKWIIMKKKMTNDIAKMMMNISNEEKWKWNNEEDNVK